MIVIEDDCGGVVLESRLHDLAGMNRRAADRSAEEILDRKQAVPAVEMQDAKDFVLTGAQMNLKELSSKRWRGQHWRAGPVALREESLSAIEDVGRLSLAEAGLV